MYPRNPNRDRQFVKGVVIFGSSLVGLVVVGLFMGGVLGGEDETTSILTQTRVSPVVPVVPEVEPLVENEVAAETEDTIETFTPVVREVTYQEAESAYMDKQYGEALDLFTLYTDQHPGNAWGRYMFGLSAWKAGQPDDAITGFRSAIQLDPKHIKSHLNLTRVLLEESRPGEALPEALKAVELDSTRGEAYRMLGRVHHNLGQTDDAVASYRKAVSLNGKDVWAMNNLGLLLIEKERFEEALLPLARATQLDDDVVVFQNNLGIALERTGRYSTAAGSFRRALEIDDTNDRVLANLKRVDGRQEEPGRSVDLTELASRFTGGFEVKEPELTESTISEDQP